MPTSNISAPTVLKSTDYTSGYVGGVSGDDYTAGKIPLVWAENVRGYPATEAITIGAAVALDTPTATAPLSVHLADAATATDEVMTIGIALNAAAIGEIVSVADIGYVRGTVAGTLVGEGLILGTDGVCGAGATYVSETHPFIALQTGIADFYGSGLDAVLAKFVGV